MPQPMQSLIEKYIAEIKKIYSVHLRQVILYVDILILLDLSDLELKTYSQQLSYMTYDFNLDYGVDIKPIAKSEEHFRKWVINYPFYASIDKEGVVLYGAA